MRAAILVLTAVLFLSAHSAQADEVSKAAKLNELMVLQGRKESAQQRLEVHKRQMMEMGARALEQYRTQAGVSEGDPIYKKWQTAYERFLDVALPPWTAQEATDLYASLLARDLDEAEIDALLEFAKSPVGRKATLASNRASNEWQETLGKRAQESILAHYRSYVDEMSKIQSDYEAERGGQPASGSLPHDEKVGGR